MKSKRIIAVHLLNDFSGSPLVFRQALEALEEANLDLVLFTATPSGSGFLSNLPGVTMQPIAYKWHPAKLVTLWYYLNIQLRLFFRLLFFLRSTDEVYINTLLPFGAALAGGLRGCRVVYHVHEVSLKPWLLKAWLRSIANITAQEVLFVSKYTQQQTGLTRPVCRQVYNALRDSFTEQASQLTEANTAFPFTALMLCSNKAYKGIHEFVACARQLPHIRFMLVLNAKGEEVEVFRNQVSPPDNCSIYPAQADTIPFYEQAHVVLNLSNPDAWVETFGMTALEAMACGRPIIVPPVGGICELIEDSKEGFTVDARKPALVVERLQLLSSDMNLYLKMAQAARQRAKFFSARRFRQQITDVFVPEQRKDQSVYSVEKLSRIGND
ncbi:glycosyltransferase family 4 protein [Spirosoma fluviale]|uniref:Glycosyltransferase involved in cell wall bisynthesis n=1 Tax=Spirosoma fluviale TaxID=1597977 RepID=A0A286F7X0_9BACT|nr:glycosyltransferase family 4 protein [Spirosoma fluviale]SOD79283.1 Glycosyltransferase involved in cell wall bisynthesis [Spirosoma fluviale]